MALGSSPHRITEYECVEMGPVKVRKLSNNIIAALEVVVTYVFCC